jgi:hypothetical protein
VFKKDEGEYAEGEDDAEYSVMIAAAAHAAGVLMVHRLVHAAEYTGVLHVGVGFVVVFHRVNCEVIKCFLCKRIAWGNEATAHFESCHFCYANDRLGQEHFARRHSQNFSALVLPTRPSGRVSGKTFRVPALLLRK